MAIDRTAARPSRPPLQVATRAPAPTNGREVDADGVPLSIGGLTVKLASQVAEDSLAICIIAQYGVGKTSLWATALDWRSIKHPRAYVIETEGGLRPVRSRGAAIRYGSVTSWEEADKVMNDLERGDAKHFGLLVIDNASELADMLMETTLKDQGKEEPDWEAWRFNSRKFLVRAVRRYRNIGRKFGIPVVFTLWDRDETNDAGMVKAVHADLNPALRKKVMGAVDLACWEEILTDGKSRGLHLSAGRRTDTKIRLDPNLESDRSIPTHMYNPSLVPILESIVDGIPWPNPNPYAFPEGLTPRWSRDKPANPNGKEAAPTSTPTRPQRPKPAS